MKVIPRHRDIICVCEIDTDHLHVPGSKILSQGCCDKKNFATLFVVLATVQTLIGLAMIWLVPANVLRKGEVMSNFANNNLGPIGGSMVPYYIVQIATALASWCGIPIVYGNFFSGVLYGRISRNTLGHISRTCSCGHVYSVGQLLLHTDYHTCKQTCHWIISEPVSMRTHSHSAPRCAPQRIFVLFHNTTA